MAKKAKRESDAGRPPIMERAKLLSVRLPESLIGRVDDYADFEMSRSDAIRELLDAALRRKGK